MKKFFFHNCCFIIEGSIIQIREKQKQVRKYIRSEKAEHE